MIQTMGTGGSKGMVANGPGAVGFQYKNKQRSSKSSLKDVFKPQHDGNQRKESCDSDYRKLSAEEVPTASSVPFRARSSPQITPRKRSNRTSSALDILPNAPTIEGIYRRISTEDSISEYETAQSELSSSQSSAATTPEMHAKHRVVPRQRRKGVYDAPPPVALDDRTNAQRPRTLPVIVPRSKPVPAPRSGQGRVAAIAGKRRMSMQLIASPTNAKPKPQRRVQSFTSGQLTDTGSSPYSDEIEDIFRCIINKLLEHTIDSSSPELDTISEDTVAPVKFIIGDEIPETFEVKYVGLDYRTKNKCI